LSHIPNNVRTRNIPGFKPGTQSSKYKI